MQMGLRGISPPAWADPRWGDGAHSSLLKLLRVPAHPAAPALRAHGSDAGLPQQLLSDNTELLSSELAGTGGAQEAPHLVLTGKGAALPLPRAAALPSCCLGQPCTPVRPSPQLAGAFDLPLREGQGIGSRGHSAPGASPTSPVCAEPFEAVLSSAAERGGHGLCLLSSKEPAAKIPPWALHVPQELAGVLFYSHFLCLPLKKISVLWEQGLGHPWVPQGLTRSLRLGRAVLVYDNQQDQGFTILTSLRGGTWPRPPASPAPTSALGAAASQTPVPIGPRGPRGCSRSPAVARCNPQQVLGSLQPLQQTPRYPQTVQGHS